MSKHWVLCLPAHPLWAASAWTCVNRLRHPVQRVKFVGLGLALLLTAGYASDWAIHHRDGSCPAWFMALLATIAAAGVAYRHARHCRQRLRQGWMQAWPLSTRDARLWAMTHGIWTALWRLGWPISFVSMMFTVAGSMDGLCGCLFGAICGAALGSRMTRYSASSTQQAEPADRHDPLGACQPIKNLLQQWQWSCIGHVSVRRWAPLIAGLLFAFPAIPALRWRDVLQIVLLLAWPFHLRAMHGALATLHEAWGLLAATPWPRWRWSWRLLRLPLSLALLLPVILAADLGVFGLPFRSVLDATVLTAGLSLAQVGLSCAPLLLGKR